MKAYPNWFYGLLLASFIVLGLSGLLLIPTMLDMRLEYDVFWRLSASDRLISVAFHVMSSYLIMMLLGALSVIHMRAGMKTQRNARTGLGMVALFSVLLMTGVGLFYLGDDMLVLASSLTHTLVGGILLLVFFVHFYFGRMVSK
jgi:heme A synthase